MSVVTTRDPHSVTMCPSLALKHTHSTNGGTMVLSKTMINHYIITKRGQCYHGDIKWSMLLCISTEKFTIAVQLSWCLELLQARVALKRDPLFWDPLSLPLTSVVQLNMVFVVLWNRVLGNSAWMKVLTISWIALLLKVILSHPPHCFL